MSNLVFTVDTENGQVLTVVPRDTDPHHGPSVTVRTAKDGHNRSVAKLSGAQTDSLIRALIAARGGEWLDLLNPVA